MPRYLPDPLARARDDVYDLIHERPRRSLFGVVAVAGLVMFGLWIWPEIQRTIKIHRM